MKFRSLTPIAFILAGMITTSGCVGPSNRRGREVMRGVNCGCAAGFAHTSP